MGEQKKGNCQLDIVSWIHIKSALFYCSLCIKVAFFFFKSVVHLSVLKYGNHFCNLLVLGSQMCIVI